MNVEAMKRMHPNEETQLIRFLPWDVQVPTSRRIWDKFWMRWRRYFEQLYEQNLYLYGHRGWRNREKSKMIKNNIGIWSGNRPLCQPWLRVSAGNFLPGEQIRASIWGGSRLFLPDLSKQKFPFFPPFLSFFLSSPKPLFSLFSRFFLQNSIAILAT